MVITLTSNASISFVLKSGKHESVTVSQGIAEVTREKVTVFLSE